MKKISFLLLHLGYGGIETATINSANALCEKYDVELISFYNLKDNQANFINKNVKVKYLYNGEPNKKEIITNIKKLNLIGIIREGYKASKILINKKRMIKKEIINSDSFAIVSTRVDFSVLLSKYGNKKIIKIAQEHHHHNYNKKYINILKYKYKNINYLCALTNSLKSDYINFLRKSNKKTKVVLLPNMLTSFPEQTSNLKKQNLISVGRLHEGKRIDELVRIFSKLDNKNTKLYIIGTGQEEDNIKKIIKELNLEDRVIMTGYLNKEQQKEYWLNSCIFTMTSVSEGLPMVLLEAMQYGIPCIAYDTESGIKDIIKNNKNGYIIKNRNEAEYIKKLNLMLSDTKRLKVKGKEAIATSQKYSKDNILKLWYNLLK